MPKAALVAAARARAAVQGADGALPLLMASPSLADVQVAPVRFPAMTTDGI